MSCACESNLNERPAGDSSFPRRIGAAIAHFFQRLPYGRYPCGTLRLQKPAKFFSRDPHVTADHYGARNLRLWQVILVWILAIDLLVMMLWRL